MQIIEWDYFSSSHTTSAKQRDSISSILLVYTSLSMYSVITAALLAMAPHEVLPVRLVLASVSIRYMSFFRILHPSIPCSQKWQLASQNDTAYLVRISSHRDCVKKIHFRILEPKILHLASEAIHISYISQQ